MINLTKVITQHIFHPQSSTWYIYPASFQLYLLCPSFCILYKRVTSPINNCHASPSPCLIQNYTITLYLCPQLLIVPTIQIHHIEHLQRWHNLYLVHIQRKHRSIPARYGQIHIAALLVIPACPAAKKDIFTPYFFASLIMPSCTCCGKSIFTTS